MSYWRLHYHLVWATFQRHPLIDAEREQVIRNVLSGKCGELGIVFHELGASVDHLHLVVSSPPRLAVAEMLRQLKGASSHAANRVVARQSAFKWQDGYGAITVSEDRLPIVIEYASRQKQHHANGSLLHEFERTGDDKS